MKRIKRLELSEILKDKLQYPDDRKKILSVLTNEQAGYCAYTEKRIKATSAMDVEHFNPEIKDTQDDGYYNWFAVNHKWNLKKGDVKRWKKYQPILHPTSADFEQRVVYDEITGVYICRKEDYEAENLIKFLNINNAELVSERTNKIILLEDLYKESNKESFTEWLSSPGSKQNLIEFRRALETVFKINL